MRAAASPAGDGGDAAAFPWDAAMTLGLGILRMSPRDFWRMSPRELAAALGRERPRAAAPGRPALDAMMRLFPDRRR